MKNTNDLTQGHVGRTILRLTAPMTIGILSMIAFNIVDSFFVGQLGKLPLAALSFSFPIILIIFAATQGVGVGVTAIISKSIGAGDHSKAKSETTNSLILGFLLVTIFSSIGLVFITPIFKMMGADEMVLPYIKDYMTIWFFTLIAVLVPFVGNSAIRAAGNTKIPTFIMLFAIGINALLDPLLIFGLAYGPIHFDGMGIQGAAIATAISRGASLVLTLFILHQRFDLIDIHFHDGWMEVKRCWRALMLIGIPASISRMIAPLGTFYVTYLLAQYGSEVVAGFGVGMRIISIGVAIISALSASLAPFVGQNLGAMKYDRAMKAFHFSCWAAIGWGVLFFLITFFSIDFVAPLFNEDQKVVQAIIQYMMIITVGLGLNGCVVLTISVFNTINKSWDAFFLKFAQDIIVFAPLAWVANIYYGVNGIYFAALFVHISFGLISIFYGRYQLSKLYNWRFKTSR